MFSYPNRVVFVQPTVPSRERNRKFNPHKRKRWDANTWKTSDLSVVFLGMQLWWKGTLCNSQSKSLPQVILKRIHRGTQTQSKRHGSLLTFVLLGWLIGFGTRSSYKTKAAADVAVIPRISRTDWIARCLCLQPCRVRQGQVRIWLEATSNKVTNVCFNNQHQHYTLILITSIYREFVANDDATLTQCKRSGSHLR